jgi:signal transduction histidine kinase
VATFVIGWVINHAGESAYESAIKIFSGCLLGVIVITVHFFVTLFLLRFYRTNLRLTKALKEADESKAALKQAYEQLSETAVYEERNRIARDIHDNAGHSMTAVIMQTEAAKILIDTNPEEAKSRIISANIQAKNALDQMRESVHLLAGRSQISTIKEEAEEIIAQTIDGTDVKIRSDIEDVQLANEKRRFILNSLKECFANGLRHGGATAFYVELKEQNCNVTLTVTDNGTGLSRDFKEGFGIKGMREKAMSFGGSIRYESEDGDGLEMCVALPKD